MQAHCPDEEYLAYPTHTSHCAQDFEYSVMSLQYLEWLPEPGCKYLSRGTRFRHTHAYYSVYTTGPFPTAQVITVIPECMLS